MDPRCQATEHAQTRKPSPLYRRCRRLQQLSSLSSHLLSPSELRLPRSSAPIAGSLRPCSTATKLLLHHDHHQQDDAAGLTHRFACHSIDALIISHQRTFRHLSVSLLRLFSRGTTRGGLGARVELRPGLHCFGIVVRAIEALISMQCSFPCSVPGCS